MDFEKVTRTASRRFEALANAARDDARERGASLVPMRLLDGCRARAVRETAVSLADAELLAVVGSRPALLELDERSDGRVRSPREVLRLALSNALSDTLSYRLDELVCEGQGPDTLPEAVQAALAALEGLQAEGIVYPLLDTARSVMGEWGEGAATLALHACSFLEEHGRAGTAQDLEASVDAREAAEESAPYPGPR